jgi:hypothetical protein
VCGLYRGLSCVEIFILLKEFQNFLLVYSLFLVIVLFITIIGILLLFPLALVLIVVGSAANAFGFIAIFGRIVDSQGQALLLGAAAAGILSLIPVIGSVAGFVASTLGIGAMFKDFIE